MTNPHRLTSFYRRQAFIQCEAYPAAPFNPHPNNTKAQARKRRIFEDLPKSRNLFLPACSQDELNKMAANPALINEWVNSKACVLSTDVETAWDVLRIILGGAGIAVGDFVEGALFNGCSLVNAEDVKAQAVKLTQRTPQQCH